MHKVRLNPDMPPVHPEAGKASTLCFSGEEGDPQFYDGKFFADCRNPGIAEKIVELWNAQENDDDLREIGRAYMKHVTDGGFCWSECPSEVFIDIMNERDALKVALSSAADMLEEAADGIDPDLIDEHSSNEELRQARYARAVREAREILKGGE